jgi:hypothetical protein
MLRVTAIVALVFAVVGTVLLWQQAVVPPTAEVSPWPTPPRLHLAGPSVLIPDATAQIPHALRRPGGSPLRAPVTVVSQTSVSKPRVSVPAKPHEPAAPAKKPPAAPTHTPTPTPSAPTTPVATPTPSAPPPAAPVPSAPPERQPAAAPPTVTPPAVVPTPTPTTPDDSRPGNGYGDSNHEHIGPPGQAKDSNHEHTGPPGQAKDKHHDKG